MADKKLSGLFQKYKVAGDKVERELKSCPKCGEGFFLAQHKNRNTCGGCGYTEFKKTKE